MYPSNRREKKPKPVITDISDTMIASYGDELADLDQQIKALQDAKKDVYANVREHHGKKAAKSLKLAVTVHSMDSEKRAEAEEIDVEAQRMLAIIERGMALANNDTAHVARGAREQIAHDEDGVIIEPDSNSPDIPDSSTEPAPTAPQLSAAAAGSDPASKADDAKEPPQAEASSATQSTAAERRSAETDATLVVMPHADGSIGSERHGESVPVDTLNPGGENANSVGNADASHSPDDSQTPEPGAPAAAETAHNPISAAAPGSIRTERTPVEGLVWHEYLRPWPELFGREFAALVDDVRAYGVTKPIIMQGNIVLDGRARYLAARQAGVPYTVEEYAGDDPLRDIIAWNMEARKPHLVARGFIAKALTKLVPDRADEIADLLDLSQQREAAE